MALREKEPRQQNYQGEHFAAELSESETTFTAEVTGPTETVIFRYSPPGKVSVELIASSTSQAAQTDPSFASSEADTPPETEKTAKLYGRTAKEPFSGIAPSGDTMVIVPFAEHPTFHPDSLSNSEPEKVKNNTRYWQAAAFGEHTPLLEGLPAGKAYILTGYPKAFKKIGQGGKTEVVHNGFVVVGREAYPGLSKQRRGQ